MSYLGSGPSSINLSSVNITDGSLVTSKYADGSVTTPKLGDGAVTAVKLAPTGVIPGTVTKFTVNAQGQVTAAISATSLAAYGITDAQPLSGNLTGLSGISGTGFQIRTGTNTFTTRFLTGSSGRVTITNPDGIAGAPTVDLATITTTGSPSFLKVIADTYGRITNSAAVQTSDIAALVDSRYLQGNQTITVSGDASGSGTTSVPLTLATVNSLPGTKGTAAAVPVFTVNAKGLVTAETDTPIAVDASQTVSGTFANARISQSSVTQYQGNLTIAETQITPGSLLARLGVDQTITGNWTFNNPITGAAPTTGTHLTTKNYVDSAIAGLSWKLAVKAATTGNLTLSGTQTIDGVSLVANDRVLVKNQTTASQNGIYVVAAGAWSRAADSSTATQIDGEAVYVQQGSTLADTGWTETATVSTLGTDSITYVQFSGSGTYTAGLGLSLVGNTFSNTGVTSIAGSTNVTVSASTGAVTLSLPTTLTGLSSVTSAAFVGPLTGAASLNVLKTGDTMTGALLITNGTYTAQFGPQAFSSTAFGIGTVTNNDFVIGTNSISRIRVTSTGSVGIGNSPDRMLTVYGDSGIGIHPSTDNGVFTTSLSSTTGGVTFDAYTSASGTGSTYAWRSSTNSAAGTTEKMRLTSGGVLLINATNTASYSAVPAIFEAYNAGVSSADADGTTAAFYSTQNAAGAGAAIALGSLYNPGAYATLARMRAVKDNSTAGNYAGALAFDTRPNSDFSERARIESGGNFLIGTKTSTNNLRVVQKLAVVAVGGVGGASLTSYNTSTTGTTLDLQHANSSADGTLTAIGAAGFITGAIAFRGSNGSSFGDAAVISGISDGAWTTSSQPGYLAFFTTSPGAVASSEKMRVDSAGNVGIGTTAPDALLHVVGPASGNNAVIHIKGPSTSSLGGAGIRFTNDAPNDAYVTLASSTYTGIGGPSALSFINTASSGAIAFATNNTERMRIDSGGHVGVRVTPFGWGPLQSSLDIGSQASIRGDLGSAALECNVYYDGSNWLGKTAAVGSNYIQANGAHTWFSNTAPASAGGQVSPVTKMNLDTAGNLTTTGYMLPTPQYTASVSTSGWTSGTFYTLIPIGTLGNGPTYRITMRWDHAGGGSPFVVAASFEIVAINTNGAGADASFVPMSSTHTGTGSYFTVRSLPGSSSTNGIQVALNWTVAGTISVAAFRVA